MTTSPFLTLTEAAEYVRMNPEVLRRHCASGEVKHLRFGKVYRFRPEWLDRWGAR